MACHARAVDLDGALVGARMRLVEDVDRLAIGLLARLLGAPRVEAAIGVLHLLAGGRIRI